MQSKTTQPQFVNNGKERFKNSVEFVGNKATNQGMFFIFLLKVCRNIEFWSQHLSTRLNVLLTFNWFINNIGQLYRIGKDKNIIGFF